MSRLYATTYCGKPVGIYETERKRLLVKYENPKIDSPDYMEDFAFCNDYGAHGEQDVLSEFIRDLMGKLNSYESKEICFKI